MSLRVKIEDENYVLPPLDEVLADLTGAESLVLEEYLGNWEVLWGDRLSVKSIVVIVWLAKRHAGETATLEEIGNMKGLLFGGTVEIMEDDAADPPAVAAEAAFDSSLETSEANGVPTSEQLTV